MLYGIELYAFWHVLMLAVYLDKCLGLWKSSDSGQTNLPESTDEFPSRRASVAERNHYNFSGRHAVVTGGAAGIGLAIAHRLAEGGATVSLWDRDSDMLEEALKTFGESKLHAVNVDVKHEDSINAACRASLEFAGKI